jgi:hypothetical protein
VSAGRQYPVGYHLAGRWVTIRLDHEVLHLLDADRAVLRSLPNPLTAADLRRIRDARKPSPFCPPQSPSVLTTQHVMQLLSRPLHGWRNTGRPQSRLVMRSRSELVRVAVSLCIPRITPGVLEALVSTSGATVPTSIQKPVNVSRLTRAPLDFDRRDSRAAFIQPGDGTLRSASARRRRPAKSSREG